MKKSFLILVFGIVFVTNIFVSSSVFAQTPTGMETNPVTVKAEGSDDPVNPGFQLVSCDGVDDPRTPGIKERECDYTQLVKTVSRFLKFILFILVPIVLGMILFIGFKYLTANGDSNKLADAKRMIIPLLLGMFFIFAGWLIVYTFLDKVLVTDLRNQVVGDKLK